MLFVTPSNEAYAVLVWENYAPHWTWKAEIEARNGAAKGKNQPLRARNRPLRTPIRTQRARIRKAPQTTIWAPRTTMRKILAPFPNIPYPMVASKNGEAGRGRPDPVTEPC